MNCEICNEELKSTKALSVHINNKHPDISKEEYFIQYMSVNNEHLCPICGKPNKFIGIFHRCRKTCSRKCSKKHPDYIQKVETTNLEKYGVKHPSQNKEIQQKMKSTTFERFGVENVFSNKEIQNKIKQTTIETHGVENISQLDTIKDQKSKTTFKNYGVLYPSQNKNILKKMQDTLYERHNVINPAHIKKSIEKRNTTNLIRYGTIYPFQNKDVKNKINNKRRKTMYLRLFNDRLKNKVTPLFTLNDYISTNYNNKYKFECNTCKTEFYDNLYSGNIPRCLICNPIATGFSKLENELFEYCESLNQTIIKNDSYTISPYELDIYIPNHNLAIEFNGLYWHSENQGKTKDYHINKTNMCKEKGIQLIHIFEDEWINKQEIVKSMIKNKLGLNTNKIYARKCEIKLISYRVSQQFLNKNHIQGYIQSKISIGLYYNQKLVSVLTMGKPRFNKNYDWEILRFTTKCDTTVIGGFSKLLKYFRNKYSGSIITYADLRYGTGNVYLKNGFEFLHTSSPNYFYTYDYINLVSRHKFQKHKLSNLLEQFNPEMTEWENMQLNNYDRIWDCGNNVFVLG